MHRSVDPDTDDRRFPYSELRSVRFRFGNIVYGRLTLTANVHVMIPPYARVLASNLSATSSSSTLRHAHLYPSITRSFSNSFRARAPNTSSTSAATSVGPEQEATTSKAATEAPSKKEAQAKEKDGIPFLSQPLGVAEPPTGKKTQWADIIWDDDLRAKQRGAL